MIYRLTFQFSGLGVGWSETHALQNASSDPATLLPIVQQLAQARANFLGAPFVIFGARIAKFFDEVAQVRARGSILLKQTFSTVQPGIVGGAEPADVALVARWTPDLTNPALAPFAGATADTLLGAPPDVSVNQGGIVDQGAGQLGLFIASFRSAMIQLKAGWLASQRADNIRIASIAQNLDGTITITLERAPVPAPTLNAATTVRVRGINHGKTPIPGQLRGVFATNTTFVSAIAIGIPTPQVGGFMRTYAPNPTFLPYGGMLLEGQVGEHRRGRPPGSPRGRQPARVRG
jgi:hypothetical protein